MEKYEFVTIESFGNGVVRVLGNAGMILEVKGDYVRMITTIDPQPSPTSGIPQKKVVIPTPNVV